MKTYEGGKTAGQVEAGFAMQYREMGVAGATARLTDYGSFATITMYDGSGKKIGGHTATAD